MEGDRSRRRGRRQMLATMVAATGAVALPGCTAVWDQTGATDVVFFNAATEPKTASVTITASGAAEPHTARNLAVAPGETVDPVNRSKLPTNTAYSVEVAVEGGPTETFDWGDPTVELAPLWVLVDDTRNVKFLLQAG